MIAPARRGLRGLAVACAAAAAVAALPPSPTSAEPIAGGLGTETALPLTDSAVTVHGTGRWSDLEITVNQTADLGNQAVSIEWSGVEPTVRAGGASFAENFLQIMQCWSVPTADGPSPEQCEFGATDGVFGGRNATLFAAGGFADDRVVSRGDFENLDENEGTLEAATNWLWKPFRSVTGDVVEEHVDTFFSPAVGAGNYWLNPFFNVITTNEIAGARTRADGTGSELFEIVTGLQSTGLGCGQTVLSIDGGAPVEPRCWLVVVPRGGAAEENAETIDGAVWEGAPGVMTSPLSASAWQHRIEIPLDFNPVDTPCSLDADQRRIVGSELVLRALSSWQPSLCAAPGAPAYAYASVSDATARLQLTSGSAGAAGLAVTSQPLRASPARATNPPVYAPLTASALVIGLNIERVADVEVGDPATDDLAGVRVERIHLTPRLVAKLLTQSYRGQVDIGGISSGYGWAEANPGSLDADPDFLRFNEEFLLLKPLNVKNFGGLVLPAGTSDAAALVWQWILADPEARAWLAGEADEWGMVVNPIYATTAAGNSSGVPFGDPVPDTFPKADPHCYQAAPQGPGGQVVPPALCGTDWLPYAGSYREAGQRARAANDAARTTQDTEAVSADRVWRPDGPQFLGRRTILSVVDGPTAAQYGLQVAHLSRAGDDGDQREFIAPDAAGVRRGIEAMVPSADAPQVLVPDPTATAAGAYPLSMLTYGVSLPLTLDERARDEYATFVEYAAGPGQVPGSEVGQLPPGYQPLPPELAAQALAAAVAIRTLQPTPTTPIGSTAPPPSSGGGGGGGSSPRTSSAATAPPAVVAPPAGPAVTPGPAPAADEVRGVTPISSVGVRRFAVPMLAGSALLALLLSLEITKRPRRGPLRPPVGAAGVLVALVVCMALADVAPAAAQGAGGPGEDGRSLDAGHLGVVDAGGDRIDGGGSATEFTLEPQEPAACPGDSANENYLLYSFMVPADVLAENVTFDGLGPTPQVYERYEEFRMPLYEVTTSDFVAGLTAEREDEGGPGRIVDLPLLSYAVYREGELPFGRYRVGLACTVFNELERYWDTEIEVLADDADPAGFRWRVVGAQPDGAESSSVLPLAVAAAVVLTVASAVWLRARSRHRIPLEAR